MSRCRKTWQPDGVFTVKYRCGRSRWHRLLPWSQCRFEWRAVVRPRLGVDRTDLIAPQTDETCTCGEDGWEPHEHCRKAIHGDTNRCCHCACTAAPPAVASRDASDPGAAPTARGPASTGKGDDDDGR